MCPQSRPCVPNIASLVARRSSRDRRGAGRLPRRVVRPRPGGCLRQDRRRSRAGPSPAGERTRQALCGYRRAVAGRGSGKVDGISWEQADRMAALAEGRGAGGLRDALLVRIMSDCLLRGAEAVALDAADMCVQPRLPERVSPIAVTAADRTAPSAPRRPWPSRQRSQPTPRRLPRCAHSRGADTSEF